MRARFLFLIVFLALLAIPFWFTGTAHAQYQYYCKTPDGLTYWAYNPCAYGGSYNSDYDKGYPYKFHQNTFHGSPLGNSNSDFGAPGCAAQNNLSRASDSPADHEKSSPG
jgi:hypothetical protein